MYGMKIGLGWLQKQAPQLEAALEMGSLASMLGLVSFYSSA
jgi:hypothetical protein